MVSVGNNKTLSLNVYNWEEETFKTKSKIELKNKVNNVQISNRYKEQNNDDITNVYIANSNENKLNIYKIKHLKENEL